MEGGEEADGVKDGEEKVESRVLRKKFKWEGEDNDDSVFGCFEEVNFEGLERKEIIVIIIIIIIVIIIIIIIIIIIVIIIIIIKIKITIKKKKNKNKRRKYK
jgi:hypothetical protein